MITVGPFARPQSHTRKPVTRQWSGAKERAHGTIDIAAFKINSDGSLTTVAGSPFASGGHAPVSMGLINNDATLVVVNNDLDPGRGLTGQAPNYTSFSVSSTGALTPITNSTVSLTAG